MGQKGAKLTEAATSTCEALLKDLESIGSITARKMFGGYGVFHDKKMFAMVTSQAEVCLKVSIMNIDQFQAEDCKQFGRMPYYSLPDHVISDRVILKQWASRSIEVAHHKG